MDPSFDLTILWLVLGLRFVVPLFIPVFPLPAMILCMIIDGLDQTIFQKFTTLPLNNYQSYDKALDIYYLTIAYLSTMRNWTNLHGYAVSRFLFYFRMTGSLLFELTHVRALLLIFPNTFEFFFDFYEIVRLRWDPKRLTKKFLIMVAAGIWIFIKLPQEWWIHVAGLDMTDFLRAHPPVLLVLILAIIALPFAIPHALRRLPKADRKLSFRVIPEITQRPVLDWRDGLAEKLVLVTVIAVIFSQILPSLEVSITRMVVGVGVIIAVNSFALGLLRVRKRALLSTPLNVLLATGLNLLVGSVYVAILGSTVDNAALLFFSLMLGVMVGFYDSYRPYYTARIA